MQGEFYPVRRGQRPYNMLYYKGIYLCERRAGPRFLEAA